MGAESANAECLIIRARQILNENTEKFGNKTPTKIYAQLNKLLVKSTSRVLPPDVRKHLMLYGLMPFLTLQILSFFVGEVKLHISVVWSTPLYFYVYLELCQVCLYLSTRWYIVCRSDPYSDGLLLKNNINRLVLDRLDFIHCRF